MMTLSLRQAGRQRGYMMLLVLISLVAMTLSGIALIRSMDTNQLVAGNMAARNAAVHSADNAVLAAVTWLNNNSTTGALLTDAPTNGYYAEEQEPIWYELSTWQTCTTCTLAPDASGNTTYWIIHRMCFIAGSTNATGQFCSNIVGTGSSTNSSYSSDAMNFNTPGVNYYRISVLVLGPRNTMTMSQAFVTL